MAPASLTLATIYAGNFVSIKLVIVALLVVVARTTVSKIQRYISTREFKAKHGCQPIRQFPLKDPVLGLDFMISSVRAFREKRFLEALSNRFRSVGYTFSVRGFNRRTIFTADPDNVKTIMSLRFNDFALGGRRGLMGPLLGKGIFTTDGEEWAHSRAFLRPYFAKDQLTADLGLFEKHIGHLFGRLPTDSSTVDMNVLFHRFTLDSATEFLFGKSTSTLTDAREIDTQFANSLRFSLDHVSIFYTHDVY
jgi:cytochrome P450